MELSAIPDDILAGELFRHIPVGDLIRATGVCKRWNELIKRHQLMQDRYWGPHLGREFGRNVKIAPLNLGSSPSQYEIYRALSEYFKHLAAAPIRTEALKMPTVEEQAIVLNCDRLFQTVVVDSVEPRTVRTYVRLGAQHRNREAFEVLCQCLKKDDLEGNFIRVVLLGWEEGVALMLAAKLDPRNWHTPQGNPLHYAARLGHLGCLKLLANAAPDLIDEKAEDGGSTPLLLAAACHHFDGVEFLLDKGADPTIPDASGRLPLATLIVEGQVDLVMGIVKKRPEVLQQPSIKAGWFPLGIAIYDNKFEVVRALLDHSPELANQPCTSDGELPLKGALCRSESQGFEMVKLLLGRGADPNIPKAIGIFSPLGWLIRKGQVELVSGLVQRWPELLQQPCTSEGGIPLQAAVYCSSKQGVEMVKMLLERGADPRIRVNGSRPREIAERLKYREVARLIEERESQLPDPELRWATPGMLLAGAFLLWFGWLLWRATKSWELKFLPICAMGLGGLYLWGSWEGRRHFLASA
ncbi:MAG: ankyrin repeat domain-containing protein [Parachlamydiales bacterium]